MSEFYRIGERNEPIQGKFLGYVIHSPEKDDYLMLQRDSGFRVQRAWVRFPQFAKRYGKRVAAERVAARLDVPYHVEVWELWETETEFATRPCEDQE